MEKLSFPHNVVFREEPEGGILFNVDTGELKLVEKVAWGICHLIDQGKTRKEILQELRERYPDQDSVEADLDEFLKELEEVDMLQRESPNCS